MDPVMKSIEREVVGDDRAKVEQWLKMHVEARAKGRGGPMGPYLHEGFVTGSRVDGNRLYATIWADTSRITAPDPFGDAVRAAQAKADAEPTVIPHPVQPVPVEDHDALWRSIQDYGKGG